MSTATTSTAKVYQAPGPAGSPVKVQPRLAYRNSYSDQAMGLF
jgi:hypothetical protein